MKISSFFIRRFCGQNILINFQKSQIYFWKSRLSALTGSSSRLPLIDFRSIFQRKTFCFYRKYMYVFHIRELTNSKQRVFKIKNKKYRMQLKNVFQPQPGLLKKIAINAADKFLFANFYLPTNFHEVPNRKYVYCDPCSYVKFTIT